MNHRPRLIFAALSAGSFAAAFAAACVGEDAGPGGPATCTDNNCVDGSSTDSPTNTSDTSTTNNPGGDGGGGDGGGGDGSCSPCNGEVISLRGFGSSTGDTVENVAFDSAGNFYVVGITSAPTALAADGGVTTGTVAGTYVAKFDSNGNAIWARRVNANAPKIPQVAADVNNLYVAGVYYNLDGTAGVTGPPFVWGDAPGETATALGTTGAVTNSGPTGGYDIYVLKINPANGSLITARQIKSPNYDEFERIGVDTDGQPIIFGVVNNAFNSGASGVIPAGGFVAKLTNALSFTWFHSITSTAPLGLHAYAITPMANGDISVVGSAAGTTNFHATGGSFDVVETKTHPFLLRLKSDGSLPAGDANYGTIYNANPNYVSTTSASSVAFSPGSGGLLGVVGRFEDQVALNNLNTIVTVNDGGMTKTPATYVGVFGTNLSPLNSRGIYDGLSADLKQIAFDQQGNIAVSGALTGTGEYGSGPVTSAGASDGFVALYDPMLKTPRWVKRFGGPLADNVKGMGLDTVGNINVVGEFQGTATFEANKELTSKGQGKTNVFFMKLAH